MPRKKPTQPKPAKADMPDIVAMRTEAKKKAMIAAFAHRGVITEACRIAKIVVQTHKVWMHEDPEYREAFKYACQVYTERLEVEADRRAVQGVQEDIFGKGGEVIGSRTKYSDALLMFRLKALKPHKYRERTEVSVKDSTINARITELLEEVAVRRATSPCGSSRNGATSNGIAGSNGHAHP